MIRIVIQSVLCVTLVLSLTGRRVFSQDLQKELQQLDSLRKGPKTPFSQVDERGIELLRKYPDPKQQGLIYYQLAHVYAQSGMMHPDRVIEYAEKAVQCPLHLTRRLRLYVYSGDALQVGRAKEPFAEKRRPASKVYLKGLKELMKFKLADKQPELPGVFKYNVAGPPEEVARIRKEHQVFCLSRIWKNAPFGLA